MKVAVIGAGNGGQAIAAFLAMRGCDVSLSDTDTTRITKLQEKGGIDLTGKIEGSLIFPQTLHIPLQMQILLW